MNRPTCCWSTSPLNSRTRTCSVDTPRSRRFTPKAVVHHAGTSMSHTSEVYLTPQNFFLSHYCTFPLQVQNWATFFFPSHSPKKKEENNRDCAATPERNSCTVFSVIILVLHLHSGHFSHREMRKQTSNAPQKWCEWNVAQHLQRQFPKPSLINK